MVASLASREVNICLIPEFKFYVYDEKVGVLQYIVDRFKLKGKKTCIIVVAEGAGILY